MARECFVFIQLPGEADPTVAGRFSLEDATTPQVGTFVYGKSYLANDRAVPLDPVALPLREEEFKTTLTEGFFGVIRDALPDDWGQHVAQRLYGNHEWTTFDLLLLPSSDRFGALSFGEKSTSPPEEIAIPELKDLGEPVLSSINKIDQDLAITEAEKRAAIAFGGGTHAGGARPKLTVQDAGAIWLAKLNRHDDPWNHVRVEAAMLDLAHRCQIRVPNHRVETIAEKDVLLVQRFDRAISATGLLKHRAASAGSVFRADEEYVRNNFTGSYMRLSREFARWGVDLTIDRRELYRRMAFNCLAGVSDDHERNHALVAVETHFRLSEAYDLSPSKPSTRRRLQALGIGAKGGEATRENLLSAVDQFELSVLQAEEIIDDVKTTIEKYWMACFSDNGVSEKDIELLAPCFDHDYFEGRLQRPGIGRSEFA